MKAKSNLISNEIIRRFNPCYDPATVGIPDGEELTVVEWVEKYSEKVKSKRDILWLLLRNYFLDDKELRLFAVWCAREALSLVENPDPRSINACNIAEKFANGECTKDELAAARSAACDAARSVARSVAWYAACDTAWHAAWYAAWYTARSAAMYAACDAATNKQISKLLEYWK